MRRHSHAERGNDHSQLSYVDVPLCALALAAVQVAKVPDLLGLVALLVESGLA